MIVVTDSTKIGRVAFARICSLAEIDALITDAGADAGALAALRDAGIDVISV